MMVFDKRVKSGFSIARTYRENGEFAPEGHKPLEDERALGQLRLGFRNVIRSPKSPLSFAVVTHARSFKNGGETELFDRGFELRRCCNGQKIGRADAKIAEERFFGEPVLRCLQCGGWRVHGNALREELCGFDGHVFKFVSNEFQAIAEFFERGVVGIVCCDALGNAANGGFGGRIEESKVQAEDRKSTRLNSSHVEISYAVFCLKK